MTVTTLSLRPTSQWHTPDAGTGRKDSRVTLLPMSVEQPQCCKVCRRLLQLQWTQGVRLDQMRRGPCPGVSSSAKMFKPASLTTVLRTSWMQFGMSGTTPTSLLRMSCAASLEASSCTQPKQAGSPVDTVTRTASSLSFPTTLE